MNGLTVHVPTAYFSIMYFFIKYFFTLCLALCCVGCEAPPLEEVPQEIGEWSWMLPNFVSEPQVPEDNPMTLAKIELGKALFYEKRISLNGTLSCESCHKQLRSFTVPEAKHQGADGDVTPRNAPSLANIAYASYLTWSNLTFSDLEHQMLTPLFGDDPIELGAGFVKGSSNHYDLQRLMTLTQEESRYDQLFTLAFPNDHDPVNWDNAIRAIACFQRSLLSFNSPWDEWLSGDASAFDEVEEQGRLLFFSDRLKCGECHAGPLLSLAFPTDQSTPKREQVFRNTGLYFITQGEQAYLDGSRSTYPSKNNGIGEFTQRISDDGKFRIPSLRNVSVTGPYMHDGSIQSLDEVIDHYARGGRLITEGPYQGDGYLNPNKDPLINGFELTTQERRALIAFLHTFTDQEFLIQSEHHPNQAN